MTLTDLLDLLPSGSEWTFTVQQCETDTGNEVRYGLARDGRELVVGGTLGSSLADGLVAAIKATIHRGLR